MYNIIVLNTIDNHLAQMLQKSLQLDFGTQSHKLFSQTKIQIGFGSKNQKMITSPKTIQDWS